MEANNEMVDTNKRHVEETRKERSRESVKNIIIKDIRPLDKELRLHRHRIGDITNVHGPSIRSQRGYKELREWDIDLEEYHINDIRILSTNLASNPIRLIKKYKSQYEQYRSRRESAFNTIERVLSDPHTIEEIIERVDWKKMNDRDQGYSSVSRTTIRRPSTTNQSKPDLTPEGLRKYVDGNTELIAGLILKNKNRSRRTNRYLSLIASHLDDKYIVKDSFNKLEEATQDLKETYERIRHRGDTSILDQLEHSLKREYNILEIELQTDIKEEEEYQKPKSVKIEPATVSVENLEMGAGIVHLQFKNYEKTKDDIKREDYETDSEYRTALKEETPGKWYNSIRVLKGGWIECTDQLSSEKEMIHLYPPSSVEQIYYSNEGKD